MSEMVSENRLKVGFIGGGLDSAIGRAHFSAINLDRKYSLESGVFSIDKEANKSSGIEFGVESSRVYDNLELFLENEVGKLDAAIVLTPTPLHFSHINKLFDHNFSVISEKALCSNSADAFNLVNRVADENLF